MTIMGQQSAPSGSDAGPQAPPPEVKALRRVMFASQKGGVGKTATAVNIGALWAQTGRRVLLVDTDPNGSLAACFGVRVPPLYPGLFGISEHPLGKLCVPNAAPNMDLLPYAGDRRPLDLPLLKAMLTRLGALAASTYDFLIIDSRPSARDMTRELCQVVDEVVVTFQCHHLAFRTLCGILTELRAAKQDGAPARLAGLLLTMFDSADPDQRQLEAQIRTSLGRALLPVSIPSDPQVSDCFADHCPVVLAQPDAPAAVAYRLVAEHLLHATIRTGG